MLCDMAGSRWRQEPPATTTSCTKQPPRDSPVSRPERRKVSVTMAISTSCSIRLHAAPPASRRRGRVVASAVRFDRRSAVLLLLSAAGSAPAAIAPTANAASIGLFGIRKKLERAEEAAAEAVRDVEEAAAEAAEVGGEAVKEAVAEAEKEASEIAGEGLQLVAGAELAGDGLVQAAVVAGAEALGVVVGLSVVNGILKPEA